MLSKKILLVCLLLLTSVLSAKESTIFHQDSLNYLQKNAMAIQFGISNNFNLTTFAGSSFSFKYHLSRKIALRAIGSLATRIYGKAEDEEYYDMDVSNLEYKYYNINGKLPFVFYPKPSQNATPYFGLGPLIGYSYEYQKSKNSASLYSTNSYKETIRESYQWNLGFSVLAGAELFIKKNISIHAEYFASMYYLYQKQTIINVWQNIRKSETIKTTKYDDLRTEGSNVYFGLSVYF